MDRDRYLQDRSRAEIVVGLWQCGLEVMGCCELEIGAINLRIWSPAFCRSYYSQLFNLYKSTSFLFISVTHIKMVGRLEGKNAIITGAAGYVLF